MSRFTVFLFLLLLLVGSCSSGGKAQGVENGAEPTHPFHKMNGRKLMMVATLLDYDYGGPNPRHDPKKGKPGVGKNP